MLKVVSKHVICVSPEQFFEFFMVLGMSTLRKTFIFQTIMLDCQMVTFQQICKLKPTDRHKCLHYTLYHLDHTKHSRVFSEALRVSRICSKKSDFLIYHEKMKSWFLVRGYPKDFIESEMQKVKFMLKNRIAIKKGKSLKAVPFVMT